MVNKYKLDHNRSSNLSIFSEYRDEGFKKQLGDKEFRDEGE